MGTDSVECAAAVVKKTRMAFAWTVSRMKMRVSGPEGRAIDIVCEVAMMCDEIEVVCQRQAYRKGSVSVLWFVQVDDSYIMASV